YYGALGGDERPPTSPLAYVTPTAAPLFVVHGDHDTYTPASDARHFVDGLRVASSQPVVYAEHPGAQHPFDLFHSIRFESAVNAIEAFAAWTRTRHDHRHASVHDG
ncbi:MAG: alpha/beta hydrolase family protein, partial [Ilumatobacteraceae bacterium]